MDHMTLIPIIRGAYLEVGGEPIRVSFSDADHGKYPELPITLPGVPWQGHGSSPSYTADIREKEADVGRQVREALVKLKNRDASLPTAIRVPGVGVFFANVGDAKKGRSSRKNDRFIPSRPISRDDVVRGRIVLVTGGGQGFGAEIARGLAKNGAFVFVADINITSAEAVAAEINAGGVQKALAVRVDVSDEYSVRDMANTIVKEAGGLDLLVSNAGVLRAGSVLELNAEDFDFVTKINYSAFFLVVKHCAPIMTRQHAASPSWMTDILQINSKSGLTGSNKNGAYAGGKFGGIGLVQSFAAELVDFGIKVNAICPGNFFDGPLWSDPVNGLFVQYLKAGKVPGAQSIDDVRKSYESKVPMGRGCSGQDVLRAILYCVEQRYETGQAVPVTGGQIMLR